MAFNSAVKSYGSYQSASEATAEFNKTRHLIDSNLSKLSRNNTQLSRMVGEMANNFDDMQEKDKLHKLQHQTNQLARQTTSLLQQLSSIKLSPIEMKQNRPVIDGLTTRLSNILRDFQGLQRTHVNEQKLHLNREKTLQQQNQQLISTEDEELNSHQLFSDDSGKQNRVQLEARDVQLIEEQERQIVQLETEISDINEVFKDLGVLIHNQASVVDSIEANTESAMSDVTRGTEELRRARMYREKIRKRKLILVIIATVVVAILLIIIITSASS